MTTKTDAKTKVELDNLTNSLYVENRWVDELFHPYSLFPYIDTSDETLKILQKRNLISKVLPIVFKRANVATIINALAQINIVRDGEKKSLLEELYTVLETHQREKQTLLDKIHKIYQEQQSQGLYFNGVLHGYSPKRAAFLKEFRYLRPLWEKLDSIDNRFISIEAILCRVQDIKRIPEASIAKTLEGSGINWLLTDLPFFALNHGDFKNNVLLLDINKDYLKALEDDLPFSQDVGWYPFVCVSGYCKRTLSSRYLYPVLQYSWMKYRIPRDPKQCSQSIVKTIGDPGPRYGSLSGAGFHVDTQNEYEILLCLSIVQILYKSVNLGMKDMDADIANVVRETASIIPKETLSILKGYA